MKVKCILHQRYLIVFILLSLFLCNIIFASLPLLPNCGNLESEELELEWLERHCLRVLPGASDFANSTSSLFGALKETFDFQVGGCGHTKWRLCFVCFMWLVLVFQLSPTRRLTVSEINTNIFCRFGALLAPWWPTAVLGMDQMSTRGCFCRRWGLSGESKQRKAENWIEMNWWISWNSELIGTANWNWTSAGFGFSFDCSANCFRLREISTSRC